MTRATKGRQGRQGAELIDSEISGSPLSGFLFRRHQNPLPSTGQDGEGCFVRRFEWHHDAAIGFKKEGHVRKRLADGDGFDGSACGELIAFVRDECRWLICGKLERVVLHLFPNGGVNSVWVARAGGEGIDDQQADPVFEQFTGIP